MLVLTFQIGNDCLAMDIRQVREVVPRVQLQRPGSSPPWLAGRFVFRGKVVPVIDLHGLLGAGECPPHLSSRIILVPTSSLHGYCAVNKSEDEPLLGLLAAQVADIREIDITESSMPALSEPDKPDLGQAIVENGSIIHLVDLKTLLPISVQRSMQALPEPSGSQRSLLPGFQGIP